MSSFAQAGDNTAPIVSVIIPAYNYAAYLPKAINSVLQQTFTRYEILVVDDGSTDNTAEVVAKFGDRVRYIHQKNAGLPSARNTGIRQARGEFVGLLDADDEWTPEFLQEAMVTFSRLTPDFAVVAARAICVDAQGNNLNLKRLDPEVDLELNCRELIFRTRYYPSGVVTRRAAIEASGYFDPTLRSSEDRDMWIRVGANYRVFLQGKRLVLIRKHGSNMSKHATRMQENIGKVLEKARQSGVVPKSDVLFWLRVRSFYCYQTAWMFFEEGRRWTAIGDLLKSILCWPCFLEPKWLNEPALFRLRSLVRFCFRKP